MSDHQKYSGRLELTWTNKDKRLLAHDDISYEWVSPTDYRVSEVRLLRDAGTIGDVAPDRRRAEDNLLIRGDALHALTSLASLPEFADEYAGKVKLVYIDPPFNTGGIFQQYDDNLEHSVWLTMLRDRLLQIRDLLADDGSVWVHLDDVEQHRARLVLDELFGAENFAGTVVWEKTDSPRMDAKGFSTAHDSLHVYKKSAAWEPNRYTIEPNEKDYPHVDESGERYSRRELRKWGKNSRREDRPNLWYPILSPAGDEVWPIRPDSKEGCWRWSLEKYEAEIDRIEWIEVRGGLEPYVKTYMSTGKRPRPPKTVWSIAEIGGNPRARSELKALFPDIDRLFDTPKPEGLLREVIHLGSSLGDVVLDCFGGSGTTAAVAHKMGRRWVTVEWSEDTLRDFLIPRLTKVVAGEDQGGVTEDAEWEGGGGFRILDVAPSMFEEDEGMVFLADWATDSDLGEATAAQLRFEYEPETPFCGRKGRQRLAVLDGIATPEILDLLVDSLGDSEKLVLCATAIAPGAHEYLKTISTGCRIRKIPASILAEYRVAYRVQRRHELNLEAANADLLDQPEAQATS